MTFLSFVLFIWSGMLSVVISEIWDWFRIGGSVGSPLHSIQVSFTFTSVTLFKQTQFLGMAVFQFSAPNTLYLKGYSNLISSYPLFSIPFLKSYYITLHSLILLGEKLFEGGEGVLKHCFIFNEQFFLCASSSYSFVIF